MIGKKSISAGFLMAALAGCSSGHNSAFYCRNDIESRDAEIHLLEKGAQLQLNKRSRHPAGGKVTVYRDVADPSALENLKGQARTYCHTGAVPQ